MAMLLKQLCVATAAASIAALTAHEAFAQAEPTASSARFQPSAPVCVEPCEPPPSRPDDWSPWIFSPGYFAVGFLVVGLSAGLVAVSVDNGDHGYTDFHHDIEGLRDEQQTARNAALVADGFFIAAAGAIVLQYAILFPICAGTHVCDERSPRPVRMTRQGAVVLEW